MSNQEREEGQPKLPHEPFNLSLSHINQLEIMKALQKQQAEKQEQEQQKNDQEQEYLQKVVLEEFKPQHQSELQHSHQLETKHSPELLQSNEQQNLNYQQTQQNHNYQQTQQNQNCQQTQQNQNYQHKQKEQSPLSQSDKFMDQLHQYFRNQHGAQHKRFPVSLPSENEMIQNLHQRSPEPLLSQNEEIQNLYQQSPVLLPLQNESFLNLHQQSPVLLPLQNESFLNLHQQSLVKLSLQNEFIQILHKQQSLTLLHESKSQLRNETPFQASQRELFLQLHQFTAYQQELFRSQLELLQLRHSKELLEKGQRDNQEIEHLYILQERIRELRPPQILLSGQNHQEKLLEFQRTRIINLHLKQQDELENRQAQELQQEIQNQLRLMESHKEICEFMKNKLIENGVKIDIKNE